MDNDSRKIKRKGTILFFVVLILIGGIIFLTCFCHYQKFSSEPVIVSEELVLSESSDVKPAYNSTHIPLTDEFVDISAKTGDYKYILYENITNSNKIVVKTVSAEEFEDFYESTPYLDALTQGDNPNYKESGNILTYLERNAVGYLEKLTSGEMNRSYINGSDGLNDTFLVYNNTGQEGKNFQGKFSYDTPWDTFEAENLDLKIENVDIKKVIGCKEMAEMDSTVCVIAVADVTTINNDGKFSKLPWIPKVGETKEITFVVTMGVYKFENISDNMNISQIQDIGILNTTPKMALFNIINDFTNGALY